MNGSAQISEDAVETFLNRLKSADTDKKVEPLQSFAQQLEHASQLPETAFDALTLAITPLIRTSSNQLLNVVLTSFLPSYFNLIPSTTSQNSQLKLALYQCLHPLLERLNEPKDRIASPASKCVALLGKKCYQSEPPGSVPLQPKGKEKETLVGYWERNVKETMGGKGKGWRGKVEGMKMILAMREDRSNGLPLKPWLGTLVDLLEDSDSHVRDQAKETVVGLLSPASTPPAARSEVKKLLATKGVRKTIADGILARIFSSSGRSTPVPDPHPDDASSAGGIRSRAPTPSGDDIPVVHVASARDLENEWQKMLPHFQGKETEHNWGPREKSVARIRGLLRGQAYQQYPESFLLGLKTGIIEALSKTLVSLRTTVAQQSCAAIQEMADYLGSGLDQFVEGILAVLGKMAGFTKKIIAERSQRALTSIITHTTCRPHVFISHIAAGLAEKNVQTRQYCVSHLKTFLDVQAGRTKHIIESTPGSLQQITEMVQKSLADTNPQARESARSTFWSFNAIWPARGAEIMGKLDGVAKKQLEKADPKVAEGSKRVPSGKGPAKRPSAISQMLAEKRKEIAASRQGTPRAVSSPAIEMPNPQSLPRSVSAQQSPGPASPKSPTPTSNAFNRGMTSPTGPKSPTGPNSPNSPSRIPMPSRLPRSHLGSPPASVGHSRTSSLNGFHASSPPALDSPSAHRSPLRPSDTYPSGMRSPSFSSAGTGTLKTPTLSRAALPSFQDPTTAPTLPDDAATAVNLSSPPKVDEQLQAQADEAVNAAQQLLEVGPDAPEPSAAAPITPAKPTTETNGDPSRYRTPAASVLLSQGRGGRFGVGPAPWEDSPRPESVTPQMLSKLQERKHEKSWWLRQKQLMQAATPSKATDRPTVQTIQTSVAALSTGAGEVTVRDIQQIVLFSQDHPVPQSGDEEDIQEARKVWEEGTLFERVFDGLSDLDPKSDLEMLENGLVLLWELIQHQWALFEDREIALLDCLFRLRAHRNNTVIESTNSLISLLVEISDPMFFLSVLRGAFDRFSTTHPPRYKKDHPVSGPSDEGRTRASGELFALTGFGLCVLKLPPEVVKIEGSRLEPIVMTALRAAATTTRQAANTLILALQTVLADAQVTLGMFPNMEQHERDFAFFLMNKNNVLDRASGSGSVGQADGIGGVDDDTRERIGGEIVRKLGQGARA